MAKLDVWKQFADDEGGSTAVEYALIAVIVAIGIIPALKTIPPVLESLFTSFGPNLTN